MTEFENGCERVIKETLKGFKRALKYPKEF